MLDTISLLGLRGFETKQSLRLAKPTDTPGSGMTILVGANNSGKSTVLEALRAIVQPQAPSFTQGRRNRKAGDSVEIQVTTAQRSTILRSIRPGISETNFIQTEGGAETARVLVLPARRVFNPYFGASKTDRPNYMANIGFPAIRSGAMDQFTFRLFAIENNRAAFNAVLEKVLKPVPDWSIDQMDTGQHYLKIKTGDASHSSEGLGEGLVSLLYIIDALYDSSPGDLIAIDEPELSLHPTLQRRLADLLLEYSATRQIVIATHSPFLVNLAALPNGGTVARAHTTASGIKLSQLSGQTAKRVEGLMKNQNNPHILGINAQEIFFVEDQVVLTEGQEDVVFFSRVLEDLNIQLKGDFFGWGVGGAENMERIAALLSDLGFTKVVGILDANRAQLAISLANKFPSYHFFSIPANDVRTKAATTSKPAVNGLLDDTNNRIRPEYADATRSLLEAANQYLSAINSA